MTHNQSVGGSQYNMSSRPLNFRFGSIDDKLVWLNFEQKKFWWLDTQHLIN